jgi:hypothetical protein
MESEINMNKQAQSNIDEIGTRAGGKKRDNCHRHESGESNNGSSARLNSAVERGEELIANLGGKAEDRVKNADRAIREHPYQALAIAADLGALVALLLARGRKGGK